MQASILVGYATRYGSTQEVAEVVATGLHETGFTVDIQPMHKVHTLAGYRAVVLGAPLFMFHWHKDALHFFHDTRKLSWNAPWQFLRSGLFMILRMRRNGRIRTLTSPRNWKSFPGSNRSPLKCLAASTTRRSYAFLSIYLPEQSLQVTFGIGWPSAPGQATWQESFL